MIKPLVICCVKGIFLPSYIGIVIINHSKDRYKPTSIMECQPRVLLPVDDVVFCFFSPDCQGSSTFTYLVGCTKSHQAVLIDPVIRRSDYPGKRTEVGESDLKLPANTAENRWLEDDSFYLGGGKRPIFRGILEL